MKKILFVLTMILLYQSTCSIVAREDENIKLFKEIYEDFQNNNLTDFETIIQNKIEKVNDTIIKIFTQIGIDNRNEDLLTIALFLSYYKNNQSIYAEVCFYIGQYYYFIGDINNSLKFLETATEIYIINENIVGQGEVFIIKGDIYSILSKNDIAINCYDTALTFFILAKNSHGLGNVWLSKGRIYASESKNDIAEEMYSKSMYYFKLTNESSGMGNVLYCMGDLYLKKGDHKKAIILFDSALIHLNISKNYEGIANVLRSKGELYIVEGDNDKAIIMYDSALEYFSLNNDPIGKGNIYKNKAALYNLEGNIEQAIKMLDSALAFFIFTNEPLGQGSVWKLKGDIYLTEGKNELALMMYDSAISFFIIAKDPIGQGNILQSKAIIEYTVGNIYQAIQLYDSAQNLYYISNSNTNLGNVLYYKGEIYRLTSLHEKALQMYDSALIYYNQVNSTVGVGNIFLKKGEIFYSEGNNRKALQMYDLSKNYYDSAKCAICMGNVLISIGQLLSNNEQYYLALQMYDSALIYYRLVNSSIGLGNTLYTKGLIHFYNKENELAFQCFDSALSYYIKSNTIIGQANVYYSMGQIYYSKKDYNSSIDFYDKSMLLSKKAEILGLPSRIFFAKAKAEAKLNKNKEALESYEKAMALVEEMRSATGTVESKQSFFEQFIYDIESAVLFMLDNGYKEKAYKAYESMKGRAFLDGLAEAKAGLEQDIEPSLRQKRDSLIYLQSFFQKKILDEQMSTKDSNTIKEYESELTNIEIEIQETIRKIKQTSGIAGKILYPEPVALESIQKVLKPDEALLEYFISDSASYCFVISKSNYNIIELKDLDGKKLSYWDFFEKYIYSDKRKYFSLYSRLVDFPFLINNSSYISFDESPEYALYDILIKPLEKQIEGKTLIIVPDRVLSYLPFEAFQYKDKDSTRFLIEKYNVKYIQSASSLKMLRELEKSNNTGFVAFADPVFDYENYSKGQKEAGESEQTMSKEELISFLGLRDYNNKGKLLGRLTGSGVEADKTAVIFKNKGYKTDNKQRLDATEDNVKSYNYDGIGYILFSTHGLANSSFQGLVFSQNVPNSNGDGVLTFGELMRMKYNAQLVYLSACETGLGKNDRGEGITGLTRAAMYAGSPAVMVSLWSVSDAGTTLFTVTFFKHLIEDGMSKKDALRQTKLDFIKLSYSTGSKQDYCEPYFWSAFVLYGE